MTLYSRPATLNEALQILASGACRILAGGTDVYPTAAARLVGSVLDVTSVADLRGITFDGGLRIGAATTWSEIAEADLPAALAGLQAAARQVGARQVQNVGTIGGNLCNASPAADGVPPLLTLDTEVELASPRGVRRMALAEFLQGPRKTARAADEVMVAVHIPPSALVGTAGFHKLGARAYLVISIAMVAIRLVTDGRIVTDIAVAVGSCSPVAQRLSQVENALRGVPLADAAARVSAKDVAASLAPIADVRATAEYRMQAAVELVRRTVAEVAA